MPDGSRLATCTTTAACPAGRWSDHFPIVRRGDWQLTESGFEFCLQTGHVGAPCIRVAVAQKRPVACRAICRADIGAGAGTEPARRTAVGDPRPRRDFPMKTRPGSMGLAQRLDVANQLE